MTEDNTSATGGAEIKKGSWQLRAILLVTFVPLVLAYVAYYTGWGVPESTVNNGQMLSPALDVKTLVEDGSGTIPSFENNRKWRLLLPVDAKCEQACENNLYITRQVDVRLGEKSVRVERYALNVGEEKGAQYLQGVAKDHPNLQLVSVKNSQWLDWASANGLEPLSADHHFYFIVDPQGFAMMKYTELHDGNQLLKDIKRILRFSPEE